MITSRSRGEICVRIFPFPLNAQYVISAARGLFQNETFPSVVWASCEAGSLSAAHSWPPLAVRTCRARPSGGINNQSLIGFCPDLILRGELRDYFITFGNKKWINLHSHLSTSLLQQTVEVNFIVYCIEHC